VHCVFVCVSVRALRQKSHYSFFGLFYAARDVIGSAVHVGKNQSHGAPFSVTVG
jgi:hypothetical protein